MLPGGTPVATPRTEGEPVATTYRAFARLHVTDLKTGVEYEFQAGYSDMHLSALVNEMLNQDMKSAAVGDGFMIITSKPIGNFEPCGKFKLQG